MNRIIVQSQRQRVVASILVPLMILLVGCAQHRRDDDDVTNLATIESGEACYERTALALRARLDTQTTEINPRKKLVGNLRRILDVRNPKNGETVVEQWLANHDSTSKLNNAALEQGLQDLDRVMFRVLSIPDDCEIPPTDVLVDELLRSVDTHAACLSSTSCAELAGHERREIRVALLAALLGKQLDSEQQLEDFFAQFEDR